MSGQLDRSRVSPNPLGLQAGDISADKFPNEEIVPEKGTAEGTYTELLHWVRNGVLPLRAHSLEETGAYLVSCRNASMRLRTGGCE